MNNDAHIAENLAITEQGLAGSLTAHELSQVAEAADEFRRVMKVNCTSCQYCMPCPAGVNIPSCFEKYNSKHAFKDREAQRHYLFFNGGVVTGNASFASQCVGCGKCVKKCQQSIAIPEMLKEVERDMEGFMTKPVIWLAKRLMKVRRV